MNWFSIFHVFKLQNLNAGIKPSFEENWSVLQATDKTMAKSKAMAYEQSQEKPFLNGHGEIFPWQFKGLKYIGELKNDNGFFKICTISSNFYIQPMLLIKTTVIKTYS